MNQQHMNGVHNNGHSSSDKHRSSSHHKSSSKHHNKDRDRDLEHKSSRSSSGRRNYHSSSSRHRDKDKEKERDEDRISSSHKSPNRDIDRHKDRYNDKDKERSKDHKSSNRDKQKEKSSSNRDKDKESLSDKDKDKDRHKSSSSSKHKNSSSSSKHRDKDRQHTSESGDRNRHRDKDRHRDRQDKSVKEEHKNEIKAEIKEKQFTEPHIINFDMKIEKNNVSQASSCEFTLSRFLLDETHFSIKAVAEEYNEQNNSIQPLPEEDEDDIHIAKRKLKIMKEEEEDVLLPARKKLKTEKIKRVEKMKLQETSDEEPPNKKSSVSIDHSNIVASHYNNIQEKGMYERSKSNIFYMRNFNNWIKSMLINEYLTKIKQNAPHGAPLKVLDMCCGKGGDLLKWEKGCITHLICTDIADISVEQCQIRYATMAERANKRRNKFRKIFSAEFFASDCTRNRIREQFKDASIKLNLVNCQFSFHYCFESFKQAECMIRNAAESLTEGGYFIGTIPDANEIIRRQKKEGSNSFGNDVYKISFLCDSEFPPLFGAKYNFQLEGVVDCPEFLVYFPMLVKLANKFGLELVMKERFEDFYKRNLDKGKGLMERMSALETYPSPHHIKCDVNNDKYSHEARKFDRNSKSKCGTLSKSEWEATSLYMVFAFRKMKTECDEF